MILRLGMALAAITVLAVASGVLPADAVAATAERTAPVLGFAAAITVVADVAARAGVFESAAHAVTRAARGSRRRLLALVVVVAVLCTAFLSLDTTAVLLTPVVVVMARRTASPVLPFALATVWLANTASLTLPVSNLTNLLAAHRLGDPSPVTWLTTIAPAGIATIAVTVAALAWVSLGSLRGTFEQPPLEPPRDPLLWRASVAVLAVALPALLLPVEPWIPSALAAVALSALAWVRRRHGAPYRVWWRDVPWAVLLFAAGLFGTAAALHAAIADHVSVPGLGGGAGAVFATAGAGLLGANLLDNLPAYLLLEPLGHSPALLAALLVGVNAGPLVTPWASLATLLWHRQLVAAGVDVPWRRYVAYGAVLAPVAVLAGAAVVALMA
ncbi:SLC13 family permease [Demequina sp. NBRC 110057]|uniref:SLC13 family permease n=1 Tax=Demequina sp. NBRC 110057 TaxID=1570346 RepID=UPI0021012727|nr:SLC13 family permease [Demequina sp. NBRC 110057]